MDRTMRPEELVELPFHLFDGVSGRITADEQYTIWSEVVNEVV
jgi:hypothetical protein